MLHEWNFCRERRNEKFMLSPCIRSHNRNRHNKKYFVKHYVVNEALFFFVYNQSSSSQSGMSSKGMSESWRNKWHRGFFCFKCLNVLNVRFWWTLPKTLFKISKMTTEPHISFTIYFGERFIFFVANCGTFVQCFRTDINGQLKNLKA